MAPRSSEGCGILIPGLPNDLGARILASLPDSHHSRLIYTCKPWRYFFSYRKLISYHENGSTSPQLLCIFPQNPSLSTPYLFDPKNRYWCPFPRMPVPCNPRADGLKDFVAVAVAVGLHLYVLGGFRLGTGAYPPDRQSASSSVFRFDFVTYSWKALSPMITPRGGSFACAPVPESGKIVVAGGEPAERGASTIEVYDIVKDEWIALGCLPRFRAGCAGFCLGREFWVMGGYAELRTVSGVVYEYYRDALVIELENGHGGQLKEVGHMWEEGERRKLGKIVVVDDSDGDGKSDSPGKFIFMLDGSTIFRYDMTSNRWRKETCPPRKVLDSSFVGFVALDGQLHLVSHFKAIQPATRCLYASPSMLLQIYDPKKRTWTSLASSPPFPQTVDFSRTLLTTNPPFSRTVDFSRTTVVRCQLDLLSV